jgi:hypothetical protein
MFATLPLVETLIEGAPTAPQGAGGGALATTIVTGFE